MIIIAIAGLKGCGKSSFAKALAKHLEENCGRVITYAPWARPLKIACEAIFGKGSWYGTDDEKAKTLDYWSSILGEAFSCVRRILQTVGTDIFRKINPDFWLHVQKRFLMDQGAIDIVIIDDTRFDNEAAWIRKHGGQILHVTRMGVERPKDEHASEKGVTIEDGDLRFDFKSVAEMTTVARQIAHLLLKKAAHL